MNLKMIGLIVIIFFSSHCNHC